MRLINETDSGNLGQLHTLTVREHRFPFLVKVSNWNRFNRFTGGTLVEKACHFFDLMRRIVRSEPVSVYASGGQAMNHKDEVYGEDQPDILDHAFVTDNMHELREVTAPGKAGETRKTYVNTYKEKAEWKVYHATR